MKYHIQVYKTRKMAILEVEGKDEGEAMSVALEAAEAGKLEFEGTDCPLLAVVAPAEKEMWEKEEFYPSCGLAARTER